MNDRLGGMRKNGSELTSAIKHNHIFLNAQY